jgi:D-alanine transaminase
MIIYLNGKYVPQQQATISVMDRGFLFGDSIYEVIPVFNGKLFRAKQHLQRLRKSLQAIFLDLDLSNDELLTIFKNLLTKNQITGNQSIYLQITRGVDNTRSHVIPKKNQPTVICFCVPPKKISTADIKQGVRAITLTDTRWQNCYIKATTLLPNILAYEVAKQSNADEAILIRDDYVTEASSSNVFIVKDNVILTPPLSANILGGITRDLVIELAKANNLNLTEKNISRNELQHADEIWLTSSSKDVWPVVMLDKKTVGHGKAGPVWFTMHELFQNYKNKD